MTTFNSSIVQDNTLETWDRPSANRSNSVLYWRQHQLLVLRAAPSETASSHRQPNLPPLSNPQWLTECLKRSPVRLVRVDAQLGETELKAWADACDRAGKTLYLRLPTAAHLPHKRRGVLWWCKRTLDWGLAATLLVALSPVMLAIAVLVAQSSPGGIFFAQWRVGQRGKLFKVLKFRTMVADAEQQHHQIMANQDKSCLHKREDDPRITPIGKWLRRYSLDELPQLINVLRGEMSLVGPRPWAIYDAVRIRPDMQARLNALPGITGAWQVEARSTLLDLDTVNDRDLEYLRNWSLMGDFKILLRTVPRVLSGFGAC